MTVPAAPQPGSASEIANLLDPSAAVPRWLKSSLDAMTAGYPPRIPSHAALSEAQRTYVAETCSRLAKCLDPASPDELAAFVVTLQDQFGTPDMDDDALRRRQQGYLLSLDGVPAFALEEAFRRIMQRRVPGLSAKFMPTGPELRDLLDQIASAAREFRGSLHRLLNARVDDTPSRDGPRALPNEVVKLMTAKEGERVRRRHMPNPAGVDHSVPYPILKGE